MPVRIIFIGAVVFLAAWFTLLRPKGEETAPFTRWVGNPATEARPEAVAFEPLTAPIKLPLTGDRPLRRLAA